MVTSRVLVLHAEREPMPGVEHPGPRELFRHPHIEIEERELSPGRGSVLVEMILGGICGTDLHTVQSDPQSGYILSSAPLDVGPNGRVMGHEGAGRVVAVGDDVDHLRPGAIVTFESIVRCHRCDQCRRGDFNQCRRAQLLGMQRDGLFATAAEVPALLCHDVGDLVDVPGGLESAACLEPAACAYVACSLCRVAPGDAVVVFGAGPIGVFAAMLCKLVLGAGAVHVVEPSSFRREHAARWADRTYDVDEWVDALPRGSLDVAVETSGVVENVDRAMPLLGPNGRVALLARSGVPLALNDVDHMITNNISIVGSRGHLGGAFSHILRLVRGRRLPLDEAVTLTVDGLEELKRLLEHPELVIEQHCKVLARLS